MWRELAPILAVGLPLVAGLGLVYLFFSDVIGTATMLVVAFALGAFAVTAWILHGLSDETGPDTSGPFNL